MEAAIRIEKLSKRYALGRERAHFGRIFRNAARRALGRPVAPADPGNEFWALRDVSLEVPRGEVVGIIGRNGAGKSTLLKILSRITEPTSGRARIRGRVGSLLEVGSGFHPDLTGRENVFLNGAILGMHRAEIARKFTEIVEFAEIGQFIDTRVKHYSSGMYMRLAFSVAAHLETEVLFCDEVLAVGDAGFQQKCLGKMDDVTRSGRTVLFVSHGVDPIKTLCQRAVWLDHGEVRMIGPAGKTVDAYMLEVLGRDVDQARITEDQSLPIQIVAASLTPADGGAPADRELQFEYVVRGRCEGVMLCIEVHDSQKRCVFYANDQHRRDPNKRRPGRHECSLAIPFSLLAPDRYEIVFGLWEPGYAPVQGVGARLSHLRQAEADRPDVRCLLTHGVTWPAALYLPAVWDGQVEMPLEGAR